MQCNLFGWKLMSLGLVTSHTDSYHPMFIVPVTGSIPLILILSYKSFRPNTESELLCPVQLPTGLEDSYALRSYRCFLFLWQLSPWWCDLGTSTFLSTSYAILEQLSLSHSLLPSSYIFFTPSIITMVLMVLSQRHSMNGWASSTGEIEKSPILLLADVTLSRKLILGSWLSRVYLCPEKYNIIFLKCLRNGSKESLNEFEELWDRTIVS